MKEEVAVRITVVDPLAGATMMVQRGANELIPPEIAKSGDLIFSFSVTVDSSSDEPNFLGKNVHGPKGARFIYVNSGTYAGDSRSKWNRRAKVSLMSIGPDQIKAAISSGGVLATRFAGVGKDGGPTCASVKGIQWRVEAK
jgi:Family of unknown function (DUF5990)